MTLALSKLNFRDVGGLAAGDGARVRKGTLYRSEGPASFFDDHRAELGALGFRSVCDLRSKGERETAPNDWCGPGCRLLNLDMNTDLRAQGMDMWESLRTDPSVDNARSAMAENYRQMPGALMPHVPALAGALLGGEVPMMVHCTAGKDRTGVAIALLLMLVGVARADILADYAKSDVFGENRRMAGSIEDAFLKSVGFVPGEAVITVLTGAEKNFLLSALAEVGLRWGSVEAYFTAAGVDAAAQVELRNRLLEPRQYAGYGRDGSR